MYIYSFVFCCYYLLLPFGGTQWRSWLRHWATNPKVAVQSFIDIILPAALWPWEGGWEGKGDRCWKPYHPHVSKVLKSGTLNLLEPSGLSRGHHRHCLTFYFWWFILAVRSWTYMVVDGFQNKPRLLTYRFFFQSVRRHAYVRQTSARRSSRRQIRSRRPATCTVFSYLKAIWRY